MNRQSSMRLVERNDPVPFACIFTGMLLANLFYWGTNQVLIQRALGAENLKEGQKEFYFQAFKDDGTITSCYSRSNRSKTCTKSYKQGFCISFTCS